MSQQWRQPQRRGWQCCCDWATNLRRALRPQCQFQRHQQLQVPMNSLSLDWMLNKKLKYILILRLLKDIKQQSPQGKTVEARMQEVPLQDFHKLHHPIVKDKSEGNLLWSQIINILSKLVSPPWARPIFCQSYSPLTFLFVLWTINNMWRKKLDMINARPYACIVRKKILQNHKPQSPTGCIRDRTHSCRKSLGCRLWRSDRLRRRTADSQWPAVLLPPG